MYDSEALQVPIEEELQGRTLHFKHVPATVSICSNVPGHTDPLHLRSNGDAQQLVDELVQELLKIQAVRERLMTEKYQPIIDLLTLKQLESQKKLGDKEQEEEEERQDEEESGEEAVNEVVADVQRVGTKRKRKVSRNQQQVSRKRVFLDDEVQLSGEDNDDDDRNSDDNDETDIEGLIDDGSDVEENNATFYRAVDNNVSDDSQPGPSTALQTPSPPSTTTLLTHEQEQVERKGLKEIRAFLSKLLTYIGQITSLGFNRQKYDIPLIRSYLPSATIKHDGTPKQIIKILSGSMSVGSKKRKLLDITNCLAAGKSMKAFYESYSVSTPKGVFPYSWFDSLEKLDAPSLPMISRSFVVF